MKYKDLKGSIIGCLEKNGIFFLEEISFCFSCFVKLDIEDLQINLGLVTAWSQGFIIQTSTFSCVYTYAI
jgi:hypothetical protein